MLVLHAVCHYFIEKCMDIEKGIRLENTHQRAFATVKSIHESYTDKKENTIFLIYKEIQGAVAKLYMGKGFLIYEEMRKYLFIYEEAVSHI
jgi:hypothetical protein